MARDGYPTDDDVKLLVAGSGVTLPAGFVFAGYADAATQEFQQLTGFVPFLKDSSDVERVYGPPGRRASNVLELGAGLLSLTSLRVEVTSDQPSGRPLTQNRDFWLKPDNAAVEGRPYTWIKFLRPVFGLPSSIVVAGRWGFGATVPDDAWEAIRRLAASQAAKDALQGIAAAPETIKDDDVTVTQNSSEALGAAWAEYAQRVIGRYKLIRAGF